MHNLDFSQILFPGVDSPTNFRVFSRHGGTSPAPFDSCNVSFGVGDEPENVHANRQKIKEAMGLDFLVSARQVHGDRIYVITTQPEDDLEVKDCDALITNLAGVGLMVQQADCQAVMLFDPVNKIAANIHSGWRGSVQNIIGKTVSQMADFGADPKNLEAIVSPSLGPCCAEFINYQSELPKSFHAYQVRPNHFDFWAISRNQLTQAGVSVDNIKVAGVCTVCDASYFSYRRDRVTGRFASVVSIIP